MQDIEAFSNADKKSFLNKKIKVTEPEDEEKLIMTFIEVGTFIIDVEKIVYIHVLTPSSVDVYFAGDVKLRITGQDTEDFLNYLRGN